MILTIFFFPMMILQLVSNFFLALDNFKCYYKIINKANGGINHGVEKYFAEWTRKKTWPKCIVAEVVLKTSHNAYAAIFARVIQ